MKDRSPEEPIGFTKPPVKTVEVMLPDERKIKLREPNGYDEAQTALDATGNDARQLVEWAQIMRCTLEIDGRKVEQSLFTPTSFRDIFTSKQWTRLRQVYLEEFFLTNAEEEKAVQASRKIGTLG